MIVSGHSFELEVFLLIVGFRVGAQVPIAVVISGIRGVLLLITVIVAVIIIVVPSSVTAPILVEWLPISLIRILHLFQI